MVDLNQLTGGLVQAWMGDSSVHTLGSLVSAGALGGLPDLAQREWDPTILMMTTAGTLTVEGLVEPRSSAVHLAGYVLALASANMANATTKHAVKQRVLESRRAEKAAREAREAAIVDGLSEFLAEVDRAAAVEVKLDAQVAAARAKAAERVERIERETEERIAKLAEAAREQTARCERAAGEAVMRMREKGETVAAIASQTGQSQNRVRDLGKLAVSAQGQGDGAATAPTVPAEDAGVSGEPTHPAEADRREVAATSDASGNDGGDDIDGGAVGDREPAAAAPTAVSA